eukprot:scaffold95715_cov33-Tisochrysis_lutea.AAC.4
MVSAPDVDPITRQAAQASMRCFMRMASAAAAPCTGCAVDCVSADAACTVVRHTCGAILTLAAGRVPGEAHARRGSPWRSRHHPDHRRKSIAQSASGHAARRPEGDGGAWYTGSRREGPSVCPLQCGGATKSVGAPKGESGRGELKFGTAWFS